ncbi:TonB-dependent receptor [Vibrio albus]|uniref:TonB-dependent receptor n=2 Tax=Vibrio albus TaxID=2200953 RepID=A0A2U3BDC3_9VIBR|nr:TonB-dependent receptor [Vibrio albus]
MVRGPMSALYGSDAIGGVINIITKTPDNSWGGHLRQENKVVTSGEQGEQSRTNIYTSGPVSDSLSLAVSGEIYDRNAWYLDNGDGSESPALEEKISRNLYTTLTWQINDAQTAEFDFNYNHDERPYSLYGTRSAYRDQSIDRLTFSGTHRGNWSWGNSTVTVNYEDGKIDDYNSSYDAPQQRELKEKNLLLNGYINTQWSIHNITLGSELQDQTVEDPVTYTETGESNTSLYALYLQDEMSLTDDLLLTLGARLDDHEVFGQHMTPRSYLVYSLNDSVTLKGGVSAAFKAPQAYQMSEEYQIVSCGGSCTLSGNPDLEPETSVNYEIGMEILQNSWDASIALFKTEAEDMIIAKTAVVNGSRTRWWANEDEVTINGIELVGSVDLTDSVTLNGNYTYLDTENTDGEDLENRPEHAASVTVDWQMTEKLSSSLTADYTGEQFDGSDNLPSYTIVDLGFAFQATDSINLSTGVKNIFDIRLDKEDSDFTQHELGQNIYVSAGIDF